MQRAASTYPNKGYIKTGYSYPMKNELYPWGLEKGMGKVFARTIKVGKVFL
jgi:hypothetical protein